MNYAILGDIHSSFDDFKKVLTDISNKVPEALIVGTGDLFECTISKKNISDKKFNHLHDVMIIPEGFCELLTFPSVKGNQEERILLITDTDDSLYEKLSKLPETIEIGNAQIIHGHQWMWGGEPWSLIRAEVEKSLVFYGHSHFSELSIDGVKKEVAFGIPYSVDGESVLVNVGAVVGDREWVLFDSSENTVTFMKV